MMNILIAYIISIISSLAFLMSYKKIVNNSTKITIKIFLMILIGSLISVFLLYLNNSFIKNCFTITFLCIIFNKVAHQKTFETFYYTIIIWIYAICFDIFIMLIVSLTGLINLFNIIYIQMVFTIIMSILLYSFCSINKIIIFTNNSVKKLAKIKPNLIIDLISIFILIYISMLCFIDIESYTKISVYIVFSIIMIFNIFITLDKYYTVKTIKELNKKLISSNEFFINLEEQNRIFKHNLNHQLLGIKSIANQKTKYLIDSIIQETNNNYVVLNDIKKIPDGINGMIYEKFYVFNNNEINLVINNNIKTQIIDNVKPKVFNELCEAIGVCIDNALEATNLSEEKVILIDFNENKESYYVNINNTFNNNLDIDEFGTKDYSTKKGIRGIGIFSILKRKNVKLRTKVINNCFIINIKVKKAIFN